MGRLIQTESAGKERSRLSRTVVLAVRELMKQSQPDSKSRDLAAWISIALEEIYQTIEPSVAAWEKKGYWVKADKFRLEWDWSGRLSAQMRQAVMTESWAEVARLAVMAGQKFARIEVPPNHRLGEPWVGAYQALKLKSPV